MGLPQTIKTQVRKLIDKRHEITTLCCPKMTNLIISFQLLLLSQ